MSEKKPPKVLIGIPTMGSIHTLLTVTLMKWVADAYQNQDKGVSIYPTHKVKPVDKARNEIVDTFLENDFTHLFFVDSDTIPPMDALDKLLALDADVASGITPILEHDPDRKNDSDGFYKRWNVYDMNDMSVEPNMGIIEMKGAGGSCLLIKRKVLETLDKPVFKFVFEDDNGKKCEISEDIYFTMMARSKGFTLKCDTSVVCGHDKSIIWR